MSHDVLQVYKISHKRLYCCLLVKHFDVSKNTCLMVFHRFIKYHRNVYTVVSWWNTRCFKKAHVSWSFTGLLFIRHVFRYNKRYNTRYTNKTHETLTKWYTTITSTDFKRIKNRIKTLHCCLLVEHFDVPKNMSQGVSQVYYISQKSLYCCLFVKHFDVPRNTNLMTFHSFCIH